jgi:transcription initiation factor TFIIIB Brf1 subunit/transcription initiation factor TFIIB
MSLYLEIGINSDRASTLNSDVPVRSSQQQSLSDISRLRKQRAKEKAGMATPVDTSIKKLLMCEACGTALIPHDGFMVCRDCGLCTSRDIDTSQEWRNLDDNKGGSDPSRVSVPNNTLMPETSVGTMVSYGSGKKAPYANIIRTMNNWSMLSYKDSTILKRFKHITTVCKNANVLDSVIEEIKVVYFKISQVKAARRNKLHALMAVSVIIGHEIAGYEKDYKEVADMFDIDIKVLRSMIKEYEFIWKELQDIEAEEQAALVKQSIDEETLDIGNQPAAAKSAATNTALVLGQTQPPTTSSTKLSTIDELVAGDAPLAPIINKETDGLFKQRQEEDNAKLRKYVVKSGIPAIYQDKFYQLNDWIAERYILAQHIPKSRYACLIFLVSELYALNVDKHKIISLCETSNVTINKCYNKLAPYLPQIIDFLDIKSSCSTK